ncbi:MAG: TetR/AcrR family transcriptional regulator [Labilithrix sp.]|nr:TetR/AcrR family transcriptional regulator [Labilithrix sp.]
MSAEEAREAILAATEKRLREVGPEGLRLQEIASDLGISHPTLLHHVGSREELLEAVVTRSMIALETDLIACFTPGVSPPEIVSTLDKVDEVMRVRGQARLIAWLALARPDASKAESRLGDLTVAIHAVRTALGKGAPFEDTAFGVMLGAAAMFGVSILGPGLLSMMKLPVDEASLRRFREWLGALLLEHAGIEAPSPAVTPRPAAARSRTARPRSRRS